MTDETTGQRIAREYLSPAYKSAWPKLAAAIDAAIAEAEAKVARDVGKEARAAVGDAGAVAALRDANDRAEKAERERDEALEQLSKWRATVRRFLGDA